MKLAKKKYSKLVLQGCCNEISNINLSGEPLAEKVKEWETQVKVSRKKMCQLAEESLGENTNLKKVIIMTSLSRYDSKSRDPHGIKENLNQLGNLYYTSLWMKKGCPKIYKSRIRNWTAKVPLG